MSEPTSHRKRIKHYEATRCVHELTFSCVGRRPLLSSDRWLELLSESLDRAIERHNFALAAFVFMPEHVHLLVYPRHEASRIDALLKAIKRPFSYRIKLLLADTNPKLLAELTIRQRGGVETFRFWQEGPGYDRNLTEPSSVEAGLNYIHRNPSQRGLCDKPIDWRWSSARFYQELPPLAPVPKLTRLPSYLF